MRADHPDRAWLDGVTSCLDAWLEEPSTSPTSQLSAGGAVERAELVLSTHCRNRPVLLTPSATYALWVALRCFGVQAGDEVLIPQYDWVSSAALVVALGAQPIVVPVDQTTLTVDPAEAAQRRTARTRALIATHLLGIPADIPALRKALPRLPIIEDCAQAFGSNLDGQPVGTLADAAVFSFGPGKPIDVGELGALVLRDDDLHQLAVFESAHPIRQQLSGISHPNPLAVSIRPHPLAAVLLCVALKNYDPAPLAAERSKARESIPSSETPHIYGEDLRRQIASAELVFDESTIRDQSFSENIGHREVTDIGSIVRGHPKSYRVGVIRATA